MRVANAMLVLAAAMALPVVGARAADSDTFNVTGRITDQNACSVSVSNAGAINYGLIVASSLHPTNSTELPLKYMDVNVQCTGPTFVALSLHDIRPDSTSTESIDRLGFGMTRNGNRIGGYDVRPESAAVVNGTAGFVREFEGSSFSPDPGSTWYPIGFDPWIKVTEYISFTRSIVFGATAEAITGAQFQVRVRAWINPRNAINLVGAERIDGGFVMDLYYM